jgi:hypothetical protein
MEFSGELGRIVSSITLIAFARVSGHAQRARPIRYGAENRLSGFLSAPLSGGQGFGRRGG